MEAGSEGDENRAAVRGGDDLSPSETGSMKKPKRQMKTPYQLEMLEKTYAMEMYPSEATRVELAEKIGLTDRQLQMWFCHRRLKNKKEAAGITGVKIRSPLPVSGRGLTLTQSPRDQMGSDDGSGSGTRSGSGSGSDNDIPMVPIKYYESPRTIMERKVIACIEAQLGEPLRDDGPILGMVFEDVPPGAFGAPIDAGVNSEPQVHYRHSHDNKSYVSKATSSVIRESNETKIRSDTHNLYDSPVVGPTPQTLSLMQANGHYSVENKVNNNNNMFPQQAREVKLPSPNRNDDIITQNEDILQIERKRKIDEARIEKESQLNEKKMKKELEKQDILRRKMEDQMKKEMERQDRERKKEEQRLLREQQRREERFQREEKREMERREKFMQRELIQAERRKQKEELRLEREAAKQKIAMERAAARKFAKESMELIEDERLELMDLAASNKGLPSIVALDYNTLQNLEIFRESLCEFPPKTVKLNKPFTIQPWVNSEDNIGNLLMTWRFCITFADILGLWPFTLDEFIQGFHDYESRLLSEIHIALLKLIIKDIEDVARTPAGGPGTNQYSAVNPEGGHPHIVEGAYAWGFDLRNWQKLLNPLTWPEILRQFALSAGFGPQLKKKVSEQGGLNDNNINNYDEIKGCEEIVLSLKSGAAAENAVAVMQEKGLSVQRKSRHRLTPGTVKFAAYHVLAFEGGKGLNVIELAEKIQKSGLRDLTTSKTPEASISVALSRDPVLFERVAPSTYCVRPAYRKDPSDAESIIAEAKEKIQIFSNGFLAEQNVDEDDRDDESECDVPEDPQIPQIPQVPEVDDIIAKDNDVIIPIIEQENSEIDESRSGEAWVQGLTEGEYSDLCVEERLNALVALISVANEGNTVRVVLEDRLDSATMLKKQMWAEAQLDRKRMKEDFITKYQENEVKDETENVMEQNGCTTERLRMQLKSFIGHKAEEIYVHRSLPLGQDRRRNRYWLFVASSSSQDPGSGRIFVESIKGYWSVINNEESFDALLNALDPRGIRESHLHIMLQKIEGPFKERVKRNVCLGYESPTISQCTDNSKVEVSFSSFQIELGRNEIEKRNAVKRYQDLQIWTWEQCFSESILRALKYGKKRCTPVLGICVSCLGSYVIKEKICPSCYKETCDEELDVKKVNVSSSSLPLRVRLIKALLNLLEVSVPSESLQSYWTEERRETWGLKLQDSSSSDDLLQVLTRFERAIKRDALSENFETTEELLKYCGSGKYNAITQLPWIPHTTAAVALRLLELDYSLSYVPLKKHKEEKKQENFMKVSSRYDVPKIERVEEKLEGSRQVFRGGRGNGRTRGGMFSKVGPASTSRSLGSGGGYETLTEALAEQGERSYGQKYGRGRRTVRRRRVDKKVGDEYYVSETTHPKIEHDDDESNSDYDIDDVNVDNTITYESRRWGDSFDNVVNDRDVMETSDEDDDDDESEDDDGGDVNMNRYEDDGRNGGGEGNEEGDDDESESSSGEYSSD